MTDAHPSPPTVVDVVVIGLGTLGEPLLDITGGVMIGETAAALVAGETPRVAVDLGDPRRFAR